MNPYVLRQAEPRDVPAITGLIRELAEFEQLSHLAVLSADKLHPHLFGPKPVVEALVGELGDEVIAFALFFTNFSTFLAKPGLYLEDLYVQPAHRGERWGPGREQRAHGRLSRRARLHRCNVRLRRQNGRGVA